MTRENNEEEEEEAQAEGHGVGNNRDEDGNGTNTDDGVVRDYLCTCCVIMSMCSCMAASLNITSRRTHNHHEHFLIIAIIFAQTGTMLCLFITTGTIADEFSDAITGSTIIPTQYTNNHILLMTQCLCQQQCFIIAGMSTSASFRSPPYFRKGPLLPQRKKSPQGVEGVPVTELPEAGLCQV